MAGRGEHWDRERFAYERDLDRDRPRDRFDDDRQTMRGGRGRDQSDDRYDRRYNRAYDDDAIRDRRFHDDDPRLAPQREAAPDYDRRVVIDKERDREYYRDSSSPRRPAFLRRQSSLDTFDRRPARNFYDQREEYGPPARREDVRRDDYRAPPYTPIPLPKSRGLPPARRADRGAYDEINVAEPDFYGDDEYRPYPDRIHEREMVRTRQRRDSSRDTHTTRARTHRSSSRSSTTTSTSSSSGGTTVRSEYPKKGKTRIPGRLVSKRAVIDLGYPFTEEGTTVIVQRALGQDNIDQLLKLSEEYKKSELEVAAARSSAGGLDDRRDDFVIPPQTSAPPPPAPIVIPPPPPPAPVIIEAGPARTVGPEYVREVSPSRTSTTSSWDSHYHNYDSGPVPVGPMALAERRRSRSHSRGGREIRAEIRALEQELAHRPKPNTSDNREIVRAERLPDGQLVVYEESVEKVVGSHKPPRLEKDKKGRMTISVPKYR